MSWTPILVVLFVGFVLGLVAAFALRLTQAKTAKELADELFRDSEAQRKASVDAILQDVKAISEICRLMHCQDLQRNF